MSLFFKERENIFLITEVKPLADILSVPHLVCKKTYNLQFHLK